MANSNSMYATLNRVLVIGVTEKDGAIQRLRIKNGDAFLTVFLSKKMPPLPDSIKEGSQITVAGFIKAAFSDKYGMQYSVTATSVVELDHTTNRAKSTTSEDTATEKDAKK